MPVQYKQELTQGLEKLIYITCLLLACVTCATQIRTMPKKTVFLVIRILNVFSP